MKTTGRQYEIDITDYCRYATGDTCARPEVQTAYENIISQFGSATGLKHSSEVKLKYREPKADLIFEDERGGISVKKEGTIQLASGGVSYTHKCFKLCYEEIKELLTPPENSIIQNLLTIFPDSKVIMPNHAWDSWKSSTGQILDDALKNAWDKVPLFRETVTDEMLSGKRLYKDEPRAIAKYLLTPRKICEIDKKYVTNASPRVKIRIAAKGRRVKGQRHREVVVRFDYKT